MTMGQQDNERSKEKVKVPRTRLTPKTIAVVLKRGDGQSNNGMLPGRKLFDHFRKINMESAWYQDIQHSFEKIVYIGHLTPYILLLNGSDEQMTAIRTAWVKNMLKAPDGFSIKSLGDLEALCINNINRMKYTPVTEVLCSTVLKLNQANKMASAYIVIPIVEDHYRKLEVQPPTAAAIEEELDYLTKHGTLCYMDTGYYISAQSSYGRLKPANQGGYASQRRFYRASPQSSTSYGIGRTTLKKKTISTAAPKVQQNSSVDVNGNRWDGTKSKDVVGYNGIGKGIGISKAKGRSSFRNKLSFARKKKSTKTFSCKSESSSGVVSGGSSLPSPKALNGGNQIADYDRTLGPDDSFLMSDDDSDVNSVTILVQGNRVARNCSSDSLNVYCGETILQPTTLSDGKAEDHNLKSHPKPSGLQRNRGTTNLKNAHPSTHTNHRPNYSMTTESQDSADDFIPTDEMYFQKHKKNRKLCVRNRYTGSRSGRKSNESTSTMRSKDSQLTLNSSQSSAGNDKNYSVVRPNVSSINMSTGEAPAGYHFLEVSTILDSTGHDLARAHQYTRPLVEGKNNKPSLHSTPYGCQSVGNAKSKFHVTGLSPSTFNENSKSSSCSSDVKKDSVQVGSTFDTQSACSEAFCDCDKGVFKCGHQSILSARHGMQIEELCDFI